MNWRSGQQAEFDFMVAEDGSVGIPSEQLDRLNLRPGSKVRIHVKGQALPDELRQPGVTDDEIERIASLQHEPVENVTRFLLTESSQSMNAEFKKRARGLRD